MNVILDGGARSFDGHPYDGLTQLVGQYRSWAVEFGVGFLENHLGIARVVVVRRKPA
jgi:hypothetical protein